ncbi:MAG: transcription-repair coupling factor [Ruminococcaceae bacterium]|nr:transcription-repair coupling factor [Oscillospiraceae bacterium]
MRFLDRLFDNVSGYSQLEEAIKEKRLPAAISGTGSIHKAHIVCSLCKKFGTAAMILPDEVECSKAVQDLEAMGLKVCRYPVKDISFHPLEGRSREFEQERVETLCRLLAGTCDVVVATPDAAMQLTLSPSQLRARTIALSEGATLDMDNCAQALVAAGYERTDIVEGAGQFSIRGGIVDIFPPDFENPVRAELWGDEIDTLSYFDAETQRRTDRLPELTMFPAAELAVTDTQELAQKLRTLAKSLRGKNADIARERLYREADSMAEGIRPANADKYLPLLCEEKATLFDYLPEGATVVVGEHTAVRERAKQSSARLAEEIKALMEDGMLCRGLTEYAISVGEFNLILEQRGVIYCDTFAHGSFDTPVRMTAAVDARQLPVWDGTVKQLIDDIAPMLMRDFAVVVLAGSYRAANALCSDLVNADIPARLGSDSDEPEKGKVIILEGSLSAGMEYPGADTAVITWGRRVTSGKKRKPVKFKKGESIQSLSELSMGDYVVHVTHGIGLFGGIVKIASEGVTKDYIKITYDRGDILYVPVTQLDMVSKYIGSKEDSTVKLSKLGGTDWSQKKQRVRKAVKDIAKELIKLYSERMKADGYPFYPDDDRQRDFELRFEYEETSDQIKCIDEIKQDMQRPVPMDRLLCGDVGFGKTEVALRAAFKCVAEGRQCAILAPTTILAWQHYQTALKRFDGFDYRIELLSRFRTQKQKNQIIKQLKAGEIDLLIGTHSLIGKSVEFSDLGLAIIDEEQRFGVKQKEHFKSVFSSVDVLTISATPIPRTLNMALSGLRDISVLEEAPMDRLPVQTYVMEYDRAVIADAIRRELRRGGQVYYLHNRVGSIESCAARVAEMAPDAVIGVAHGQMSEEEISREWKRLLDHEIDILVCTMIIEAGVDVPNANTLIVEQADRFGLSQLYQLRGRVGRSSRRAYAYLTFKRGRELTEIAAKRLQAIREFTEFGSGMKIAMRDLEIRGAGNILGGEQSGHLESVGYDMYLKLLGEAVAQEKGEKPAAADAECTVDLPIEAHIPERYIESLRVRLDVYRMIADIRNEEQASDVIDELIDRFGDLPPAVDGLIKVALARNTAAAAGITEIKQLGGNIVLFMAQLDMEKVSLLAGELPGRVMLSAGEKPYITVKPDKKLSTLENVEKILAVIAAS